MKRAIRGLLFAVVLSLSLMPRAEGEEKFLPDLKAPHWNKQAPAYSPEMSSFLPSAIPSPGKALPIIAIVIDDMGVDVKRSARAVKELGAPVTLSYLAYSQHIHEQVASAKAAGHEIILHMPWEPDNRKADPGPHHLSVSMSKARLRKNVLKNLDGFEGYVGVNNHMGSRFSRYRPGLEVVMAEIRKRKIFYLDSKTTPDSVAEKVAREYGVPTTHRDVFLDHDEEPELVGDSLQEVEEVARRKGSAIAIGHPKDVTLEKLEDWLPTLQAKGFRLVSLSEVLAYRQAKTAALVASKFKK